MPGEREWDVEEEIDKVLSQRARPQEGEETGLPTIEEMAAIEERRGAWYRMPEEIERLRERLGQMRSKLLIVAVGSGACMMMLHAFEKHLDLLVGNVPVFIDTNVYTLSDVWDRLSDLMQQATDTGFRPVLTQEQLYKNLIPIGKFGAKKDPRLGLQMFRAYANAIVRCLKHQFDRFGCEGAVVVASEGGGTGTLVGPVLAKAVATMVARNTATLFVMTLPLRINPKDIANAREGLDLAVSQRLRPIVIDIECVAEALKMGKKKVAEIDIYKKGKDLIATLLASMVNVLTHRLDSIPPYDFGNIDTLIKNAPDNAIGCMMHASYKNLKEMEKNWRTDMMVWQSVRARMMDKATCVSFLVGRDIPEKLHQDLTKFLMRRYAVGQDDLLVPLVNIDGYEILTLLWGLDPMTVAPPLSSRR